MNSLSAPNFIKPNVAAGVLFLNNDHCILMVVPTYKDYADIPGGYAEASETPWMAAKREVKEELGIEPPIGKLLVADWWSESPEGTGAKLLFIFDGGVITQEYLDQIYIDGNEIKEYRFYNPDELDRVTIPRLANRVRYAVASQAKDIIHYLENGRPVELRK